MADHLMVSVEKKSVISNQVRVVSERELRNSNGCSSKPVGRKVSNKFDDKFDAQGTRLSFYWGC